MPLQTQTRTQIERMRAPVAPNSTSPNCASSVAIRANDGSILEPTFASIAEGKYPIQRPLLLVVNDKPSAAAKIFVDYLLSPPGQALVRKHGFLGLSDLPGPSARPDGKPGL